MDRENLTFLLDKFMYGEYEEKEKIARSLRSSGVGFTSKYKYKLKELREKNKELKRQLRLLKKVLEISDESMKVIKNNRYFCIKCKRFFDEVEKKRGDYCVECSNHEMHNIIKQLLDGEVEFESIENSLTKENIDYIKDRIIQCDICKLWYTKDDDIKYHICWGCNFKEKKQKMHLNIRYCTAAAIYCSQQDYLTITEVALFIEKMNNKLRGTAIKLETTLNFNDLGDNFFIVRGCVFLNFKKSELKNKYINKLNNCLIEVIEEIKKEG